MLGTLLAGGTAYLVSRNMTPIYRASTTLLINQARSHGVTDYTSLITSERLAKTYAELLTKRPVRQEVARRLGLEDGFLPAIISVQPVRDTQLLQVSVEGDDPQLAMDIANTLPEVFIEQNAELQLSRFASSKENLSEQLAIIDSDMKATQQAINDLQSSDSAADQMELARRQTILTQHQSNYASLLSIYEGIRLAEVQALDNIVIAEPAELPKYPFKPRKLQNTLLAAVVGCMLAVGMAFLLEYLDYTIKTPEDLDAVYGMATLGVIGVIQGGDRGSAQREQIVALSQPRSPIAEAFRSLRTNIQFANPGRQVRSLLITSAGPTEGKTLTAANLAVSLAGGGSRVILVDTDLRRPRQHRLFEVPKEPGFTNLVIDQRGDLDGYLRSTSLENLKVLPSGTVPPNPAELLGSPRAAEVMEQLKEHADVVVYDSPPAGTVTDAVVMASRVDAVLQVVQAGRTRRDLVVRGREMLEKVGARVLGPVLNQVSLSDLGYYSYYYYYGYYRDGDERESEEPSGLRRLLPRRWQRRRRKRRSTEKVAEEQG